MTKQETLFLLVPRAFLVFVAWLAMSSLGAFSFSPRIEQRRQQQFEEFVAKVQSGEVHPTTNQWIKLLRSSKAVAEPIVAGHIRILRILSCGILVGVALQVYVIFRVRAGLKNRGLA